MKVSPIQHKHTLTEKAQADVVFSVSSTEQHSEQSRIEMDNKALQLQTVEMERRKAAVIATKEYNLAKVHRSDKGCKTDAENTDVFHLFK